MTATPEPPSGAVLALDPGIVTGWALFTPEGRLLDWGNTEFGDTLRMLAGWRGSAVVYEDYRLRYKGQPMPADSKHTASQVIGAVKLIWWQGHVSQVYPQEVEVLTIASMHTGLKRPSDHKTGHRVDAILHGAYFFERLDMKPDLSAYRSSPVN